MSGYIRPNLSRLLGNPTAAWFGMLLLPALLPGCGPQDESANTAAESSNTQSAPEHRIALVMKTLTNPFFIEMEKGARRAENEHDVELIVRTAAQETSIEQQINIVRDLIREQVDAIVIAPGDSVELIPVLKKAQDAGILVINIDNRLDLDYMDKVGLNRVPFISVDNEAGAYKSAMTLSERLPGPAKIGIIEGIRGASNAEDRKNGALRAFAEREDLEVIDSQTAHWKVDEGRQVAQRMMERNPDIQALFCANDMMAIGAMKFLSSAGRDDVLVAGYDALTEAVDAVGDGRLVATIDQQAGEQGYLGVIYAINGLAGRQVPAETLVETRLISGHGSSAQEAVE